MTITVAYAPTKLSAMTLMMIIRSAALGYLFAQAVTVAAQCNNNVVMKAGGPPPIVVHSTNNTVQFDKRSYIMLAPAIHSDSVTVELDEDLPDGSFIGFYVDSSEAVTVNKRSGRLELIQFYQDGSVKHKLLRSHEKKNDMIDEHEFFRSGDLRSAYLKNDTAEIVQQFDAIGDTVQYQVDCLQESNGLVALVIETGCGNSTRMEFYRLNKKKVLYRRYQNQTLTSFGTVPYETELWLLLWSVQGLPSLSNY